MGNEPAQQHWASEVICPKTHSDVTTSSWKQGGFSRALWIPTGSVPTSPCPQKALSPVRTQCPSRSPAPTWRPRASLQECGPGPGSGQRDSQGGDTMESRARERADTSVPSPHPSTAALAGNPATATFACCWRGEGHEGGICWVRGHRAPVPEGRRAWGRSRVRSGREGPG